jgi:hypothetical protein
VGQRVFMSSSLNLRSGNTLEMQSRGHDPNCMRCLPTSPRIMATLKVITILTMSASFKLPSRPMTLFQCYFVVPLIYGVLLNSFALHHHRHASTNAYVVLSPSVLLWLIHCCIAPLGTATSRLVKVLQTLSRMHRTLHLRFNHYPVVQTPSEAYLPQSTAWYHIV